jgi:glycosyltransferase involved in cell wall biosynthesis
VKVLILFNDFNIAFEGANDTAVHLRAVARGFRAARAQVLVAARRFDAPPGKSLSGAYERVRIPGRAGLDHPAAFTPRLMNARLLAWLGAMHRKFPFDLIYERHSIWTTAGLDAARQLGVRHVLEVDPVLLHEASRRGNPWLAGETHTAERHLVRKADRLLAFSRQVQANLERMGMADDALLFERPVVADELLGGRAIRDPAGTLTIGFAGPLKPRHGVTVLLEAFDRISAEGGATAVHLRGEGPLREIVLDAARRNPRITWDGGDRDDVLAPVDRIDLFVAPHTSQDDVDVPTLPIRECQAAGVPVIASGGQVIREIVEDGRTGILVPPGNAGALAEAVERIRRDPGLLRSLPVVARLALGDCMASRFAARLLRSVPPRSRFEPLPEGVGRSVEPVLVQAGAQELSGTS